MRTINYLVVHCTATPSDASVAAIEAYWKNELHWSRPGYHYIIPPDGAVQLLYPLEKPSNGVAGHNAESINIAYIGGIDGKGNPLDNRTEYQKKALLSILKELKLKFPVARIVGHRDFAGVKKACPCFDAPNEYKRL